MSPRVWIILGALSAALAVGLGAYHAHGLESALKKRDLSVEEVQRQMQTFEVGVRYQMYHALGLVLLGLLAQTNRSKWICLAGGLFLAGTLLFCGCLYVPVLTGVKAPPLLVPAGGLAFIVGWLALAIGAFHSSLYSLPPAP